MLQNLKYKAYKMLYNCKKRKYTKGRFLMFYQQSFGAKISVAKLLKLNIYSLFLASPFA